MRIVLGAINEIPHRLAPAPVRAVDGPGPRERMVGDGDLCAQQVRVGFIEPEPLADDRGIVVVQWHATAFERSWPLEAARLDLEQVITPVAVVVSPFADRIAIVAGQ